jgi:hypothetical protein
MQGTTPSVLIVAAAASLLAACGNDEPVVDQPGSKPALTSNESIAQNQEESPAVEGAQLAHFPCRQIISSSGLPIFKGPSYGSGIQCTFLSGDIFLYLSTQNGFFRTWCGRKTPYPGITAWAPPVGSIPVACPF